MYNYGPTAAYNWSRLHAAHLKSEWPTSAEYMAASLQQHSDLSHHYAAAHYNMTGKRAILDCIMRFDEGQNCGAIVPMTWRHFRSGPPFFPLFGPSTLNISAMSRMGEK